MWVTPQGLISMIIHLFFFSLPSLPLVMSKLNLDLLIHGEQVVVDLPKPISTCFLDMGTDVDVLSFRNLWEEGERISRTKSHRRVFCTKIAVRVSIESAIHEVFFDFIGSGANRVVFRNHQLALKISSIPESKQEGRHWDDSSVVEAKLCDMGIVGVLPILLQGKFLLEDNGEVYFFQCQPFADMTLESVFQHMLPNDPNCEVDIRQLVGFLFFTVVNLIHIFRANTKLNIVLGDMSTRNVSLAHGSLKVIDWECSHVMTPDTVGFAGRACKFLSLLLNDVLQQFPVDSNARPVLSRVNLSLTQAWNHVCRGGEFGRLLDATWGVESVLSLFNSSLPSLRARLMTIPTLPWCFGNPGLPTEEIIPEPEIPLEPFQTPTVPVLAISCVPSNPAHSKKKRVRNSHPTYWHSNRKQKQRANRRMKRLRLKMNDPDQPGSSHDV